MKIGINSIKKLGRGLWSLMAVVCGFFAVDMKVSAASSEYLYCVGIQNDAGPLTIYKDYVVTKKFLGFATSWLKVSGDWGNSSLFGGSFGNSGWMNYFRSDGTWTVSSVTNACSNYFGTSKKLYNLRTIPIVIDGNVSYLWPTVDQTRKFYYLNDRVYNGSYTILNDAGNSQNFINYSNLLLLAQASYMAGSVTTLQSAETYLSDLNVNPAKVTPYNNKLKGYSTVDAIFDAGVSKSDAVSLISPDGKYLIVAVRGTQNVNDAYTDVSLMVSNFIKDSSLVTDAITQVYTFYDRVHKKYPNAEVILTGHSLGAYLASMVALKSGEIARVFSSPANYIVANPNPFSAVMSLAYTNYIPLANVLNFARSGDPVVDLSGRHVSSEIFFPAQSSVNLVDNHRLGYFIDLLQAKVQPTFVYTNPDLILYNPDNDPIILQLNYQGAFPAQ